MTRATGIGSHPGDDQTAFDTALAVVLDTLGDDARGVPYLPEVPGRGAIATMTGRSLAVVAELGADLQPAGWRLTGGGSGIDHRRARSLLAQDLDTLEERAAGYDGTFKVQLAGPWTLAATVERPRGDRVLADHGARRDLAEALAEGIGEHVADLRRRLPDAAGLVVQIDEPVLPAVLGGRIPTASGYGRHRSVDRPELSGHLATVLDAVAAAGATPWVHSCAAEVPWDLVRGAGAQALLVDVAMLRAADLDQVAEAMEAGVDVALGFVPGLDPDPPLTDSALVERARRFLDALGFDAAEVGEHLVLAPACGLAGATPSWPPRVLKLLATAARALDEG